VNIRIASAGTGKTTSLVLRYLELIAQGVPLRRIAGVTFTRKSADALRVRVGKAIDTLLDQGQYLGFNLEQQPPFVEAKRELSGATISTIHGFMAYSLRLAAPLLHLDPDFSVLGEGEARVWFEEEWSSLRYLASQQDHPLHLLELDSYTKPLLELFTKRSLVETYQGDAVLLELFQTVYGAYETRLQSGLLAPAELERRALELTRNPKALDRLLERVQVLLIDEYQDVNPLQGTFFEALEHAGLVAEAVGDPKQSIYAFRNADIAVFRKALQEGKPLPPLNHTYRHSKTLVRFLGRLTQHLGSHGLGFSTEEAPAVQGVRDETGRLEVHWVTGDAPIDNLREQEALVLAERLSTYPHNQTAVLVRSYASLPFLERAFKQHGIPYVLLQGRGYYQRQEIRDLYHALKTALDPRGVSLAAWLRSPFCQLSPPQIEQALALAGRLEIHFPAVHRLLQTLQTKLRGVDPAEMLVFLVRSALIETPLGPKAYEDFLEPRARENVDALLFQFASRAPQSLEALLERLDRLSQQEDAGDVPQSGSGVQILTIHRAKGLEWPTVAVFDLGRKYVHQTQPLYLAGNHFALPDSPDYEAFAAQAKALEEEELYRLLYVAASRARDTLILSGSLRENPEGWASVLSFNRSDYIHKTWTYKPQDALTPITNETLPEPSAWAGQVFSPTFPFLASPSGIKQNTEDPLPIPEDSLEVPGQARAIGTLVHYAIGQNWHSTNPLHLKNLESQEVMFPFGPEERSAIMAQVQELLSTYEALQGNALPWPKAAPDYARDEDYPEFGIALPKGTTVWQGVIDRLYRVGEQWYLEDYKTDQEMIPERYYFQLGIYLEAIEKAWNIRPKARLVYLRFAEVVELDPAMLKSAVAETLRNLETA
jgi:ATP-dependent exoDNAse (exonuclease V) beta subunit